MAVWFSADLHLGHKRIIELCNRPFTDVATMNDALVERFNEVVAPDDELWLLGDICMGPLAESLDVLSRFNGRKILVPGNHDRVSPAYHHKGDRAEKVARFAAQYLEVFDEIIWKDPWTYNVGAGRDVLLSHFPYVGDSHSDEDRYADLRPVDTGLPLVHGHVHGEWRERGKMLNVGVDVWGFAPVSLDFVQNWARVAGLPERNEDDRGTD